MPWILEKVSSPDWERNYKSEDAAVKALEGEICNDCRKEVKNDGVDARVTACGFEYDIYEEGSR